MWYAIYRESDGRLLATGTVIGSSLPSGVAKKHFDYNPQEGYEWDSNLLDFVKKPDLITFNASNILLYLTPDEIVAILSSSGLSQARIEELKTLSGG